MDGHASCVGGCIVDSGKFDWTKYPDKFPGLCTPDDSYHGVTYTERFGLEGAFITKATAKSTPYQTVILTLHGLWAAMTGSQKLTTAQALTTLPKHTATK